MHYLSLNFQKFLTLVKGISAILPTSAKITEYPKSSWRRVSGILAKSHSIALARKAQKAIPSLLQNHGDLLTDQEEIGMPFVNHFFAF